MASNIKKAEGVSLIDCSMIVIEPEDGTSDGIAFTSASKLGVEAKTQTRDAIPNTIKGEVKAQKPEEVTLTGHTLTLTDTTMIMAFLPILQGGTLTMDEDGATPIKYEPPSSGKNEGKKFKLKAYTAIMEGASTVGYGCVTYPGCQGTPVLWNFEDDVFQSNEYTINSTPGAGERPYVWERVEALPTYTNPNTPLGELTVQSAEGATSGTTKLSVTPATADAGNKRVYKTAASVSLPLYDEDVSSWNDYTGADITATSGHKIAVVECTEAGLARKGGTATVVSKAEA